MIKLKDCIICGRPSRIFSKGRCQPCASKTYKTPVKRIVKKENKADVDDYFKDRLIELKKLGKSEESGKLIPYPTRANICHLLSKRNHPSVAYHPQNYVFLTVDEHSELDNKCLDVNDFEELRKRFPNSFQKIIERLRIVLQSTTERTKFIESFEKFNKDLTL